MSRTDMQAVRMQGLYNHHNHDTANNHHHHHHNDRYQHPRHRRSSCKQCQILSPWLRDVTFGMSGGDVEKMVSRISSITVSLHLSAPVGSLAMFIKQCCAVFFVTTVLLASCCDARKIETRNFDRTPRNYNRVLREVHNSSLNSTITTPSHFMYTVASSNASTLSPSSSPPPRTYQQLSSASVERDGLDSSFPQGQATKSDLVALLISTLEKLQVLQATDSACFRLNKIVQSEIDSSSSLSPSSSLNNKMYGVYLYLEEVYPTSVNISAPANSNMSNSTNQSNSIVSVLNNTCVGDPVIDVQKPILTTYYGETEDSNSTVVIADGDSSTPQSDGGVLHTGRLSRTQIVVISTCSSIIGMFFIVAAILRIRNYIKRARMEQEMAKRPKFRSCSVALRGATQSMEQLRRDSLASKVSHQNSDTTKGSSSSQTNGSSRENSSASSPRHDPDMAPLLLLTGPSQPSNQSSPVEPQTTLQYIDEDVDVSRKKITSSTSVTNSDIHLDARLKHCGQCNSEKILDESINSCKRGPKTQFSGCNASMPCRHNGQSGCRSEGNVNPSFSNGSIGYIFFHEPNLQDSSSQKKMSYHLNIINKSQGSVEGMPRVFAQTRNTDLDNGKGLKMSSCSAKDFKNNTNGTKSNPDIMCRTHDSQSEETHVHNNHRNLHKTYSDVPRTTANIAGSSPSPILQNYPGSLEKQTKAYPSRENCNDHNMATDIGDKLYPLLDISCFRFSQPGVNLPTLNNQGNEVLGEKEYHCPYHQPNDLQPCKNDVVDNTKSMQTDSTYFNSGGTDLNENKLIVGVPQYDHANSLSFTPDRSQMQIGKKVHNRSCTSLTPTNQVPGNTLVDSVARNEQSICDSGIQNLTTAKNMFSEISGPHACTTHPQKSGSPTDMLDQNSNMLILQSMIIQPGIPAGEVIQSSIPAGEVIQSSIPAGEMMQSSIPAGEVMQSSIPAGEVMQSSIPAGEVIQSSIPAGEVMQSSIPAGEVIQSSIPAGEVMQSSIPAGEMMQSSIPADEVMQSSIPAGEVIQSSIPAGEVMQSSIPAGEVMQSRLLAGEMMQSSILAGEVMQSSIPAGEVMQSRLLAGEVMQSSIPAGEVMQSRLLAGEVMQSSIPAGEVMQSSIPADEVIQSSIPAGEVMQSSIPAGEVMQSSIPAGEVVQSSIPAGEGMKSSIPAGEVMQSSIPAGEMIQSSIPAGEVMQSSIPAGEVMQSSIPAGEVMKSSIPAGEMMESSIPAGEVMQSSIPAGEVMQSSIPAGEVMQSSIPADEVMQSSIAAGEVMQSSIPAGEVVQSSIPAGEVMQSSIPAGEVMQSSIPADEVMQSSIPADEVMQSSIPAGEVMQSSIPAGEVMQSSIPAGEVMQSSIPAGEVMQSSIPAGEVKQSTTPHDIASSAILHSSTSLGGEDQIGSSAGGLLLSNTLDDVIPIEALQSNTADNVTTSEVLQSSTLDDVTPIEALQSNTADNVTTSEVLQSSTLDDVTPIEALQSNTADNVTTSEVLQSSTLDDVTPIEALQSSTPENVTPSELLQSSTPENVTPSELLQSSTPENVTPSEVLQSSTPEIVTPSEVLQSSTPEIVTPREVMQSGTPENVTPSEVLQSSTPEIVTPSEVLQSSTPEIVTPSEVMQSGTPENVTPSEVLQSSSLDNVTPSEVLQSSIPENVTPSEVLQSSILENVTPSEVLHSSTLDNVTPSEVQQSSIPENITPSEVMQSSTLDDVAPGEILKSFQPTDVTQGLPVKMLISIHTQTDEDLFQPLQDTVDENCTDENLFLMKNSICETQSALARSLSDSLDTFTASDSEQSSCLEVSSSAELSGQFVCMSDYPASNASSNIDPLSSDASSWHSRNCQRPGIEPAQFIDDHERNNNSLTDLNNQHQINGVLATDPHRPSVNSNDLCHQLPSLKTHNQVLNSSTY